MYDHKLKHYSNIDLSKPVIPIVVNYWYQIFKKSASQMSKYLNLPTFYT